MQSPLIRGGLAAALLLAPLTAAADPDPLNPSRLPPQVIYNYGENDTTRSAAMGGALRALGTGTTGVLLNPSAMAETRVYHVNATAQFTPETGRQMYGTTVVDSVTSKLAGAVAVAGGYVDPKGLKRTVFDIRVALAYPITDRLFLGLGGRYLKINQDAVNLKFPADKVSGGLIDASTNPDSRYAFVKGLTFDAGLTFKVSDAVYIAGVGQNLTYPKNGLLPTTVGGGLGVTTDTLSIEGDGIADLNSWSKPTARVMVGGEYLASNHVPIRLGYRFDQGAKLHSLSVGTGYIASAFGVALSVKRTLSSPGATALLLSFEYYFEASGLLRTPAPEVQ
jgi:opacity protein-like surface antigen